MFYWAWFAQHSNGNGWESCSYHDLNYTRLSAMQYENAMMETSEEMEAVGNLPTKYCEHGWIFDNSIYESTLVTEVSCQFNSLLSIVEKLV